MILELVVTLIQILDSAMDEDSITIMKFITPPSVRILFHIKNSGKLLVYVKKKFS